MCRARFGLAGTELKPRLRGNRRELSTGGEREDVTVGPEHHHDPEMKGATARVLENPGTDLSADVLDFAEIGIAFPRDALALRTAHVRVDPDVANSDAAP